MYLSGEHEATRPDVNISLPSNIFRVTETDKYMKYTFKCIYFKPISCTYNIQYIIMGIETTVTWYRSLSSTYVGNRVSAGLTGIWDYLTGVRLGAWARPWCLVSASAEPLLPRYKSLWLVSIDPESRDNGKTHILSPNKEMIFSLYLFYTCITTVLGSVSA